MDIKIIGAGCSKCTKLYENTKMAIDELNINVTLSKVEDLIEILNLGVMTTPSLMIDGKLKSKGEVLSKGRIIKIIKESL